MALSFLSFRPRAIDINKSLPILKRDPEEDELETSFALAARSVPQMPTGMDAEEEVVS
jgi:hypothetical protein